MSEELWMEAARTLAGGDTKAAFTALPESAARMLREAAQRPPGPPPEIPRPAGVECIADRRFAAYRAEVAAAFSWNLPGRELVTGCYFTPGGSAEIAMRPGEVRFFILFTA